jgi:hypothetical protein
MTPPIATGMYAFTPSKSTSQEDILDSPRYFSSTTLPELYNTQAARGLFSGPELSDLERKLDVQPNRLKTVSNNSVYQGISLDYFS